MASPLYIRVQRLVGGLGDIITSTIACRAARERYGSDAHITYCVEERYLHLWFDQFHIGASEILAPSKDAFGQRLEKFPSPAPDGHWDFVHDLEGPEIRYAQRVRYDIQESRSLVWCKSIDHVPQDMRPRWIPTSRERAKFIKESLLPYGLKPLDYIVVQYASAMREKFYPHVDDLIRRFRDAGYKIVVIHTMPVPSFSIEPRYDEKGYLTQEAVPVWEIINLSRLRQLALFVEFSRLVVGPDSSLTHLAPAVDTPHLGLFGSTSGDVIVKHYPLSEHMQLGQQELAGKPCEHTFPCWGINYRNYWCAGRHQQISWCLEAIASESVARRMEQMDAKYAEYNREKLHKLSSDSAAPLNLSVARKTSGQSNRLFVAVPQGIGDALWALTKLQSILKADNAESAILVVPDGSPRRSVEFLKHFRFVESAHYQQFSIHPPHVNHIHSDGTYNYRKSHRQFEGYDWLLVPNTTLENGVRLEQWLPEFEINWRVMLDEFEFTREEIAQATVIESEIPGSFAVFFMGALMNSTLDGDGHNRGALWKPEDWLRLGQLLQEKYGLSICLVGAPYDADYADRVARQANGKLPPYWYSYIGKTEIGVTLDLCRRSTCVVGYQSGIPISSCYLGVPACSWWRPKGNSISRVHYLSFASEMKDSWVPPWALESKQWLGFFYGQCTPESMIAEMEGAGWFSNRPLHYWKPDSSHPLCKDA